MTEMTYGIVAGYDGSPGSGDALRWAAREAKGRHTTLTVCLAWTPDQLALPTESDLSDLARQHGQEILARGLPYAQSVLGLGQVRADLADGSAAHVLCERSRTAELVVVGSRGHSELSGLLLGSVSWQVAGHACGRVVVVRGGWRPANQPPGPVVVGADGSAAAPAAIAFAFEEAVLRDVPLVRGRNVHRLVRAVPPGQRRRRHGAARAEVTKGEPQPGRGRWRPDRARGSARRA